MASFFLEQCGEVLRTHRMNSNLTQRAASAMMGVTPNTISRIENGHDSSFLIIVLYAWVLGDNSTKDLATLIKNSRKFANLTSRHS